MSHRANRGSPLQPRRARGWDWGASAQGRVEVVTLDERAAHRVDLRGALQYNRPYSVLVVKRSECGGDVLPAGLVAVTNTP